MGPSSTATKQNSSSGAGATASVASSSNNGATNKDEMSIGSQESISPRWITPEENKKKGVHLIHWVGVLRDDIMVAEYMSEDNNKILQMSRRFLKKPTPSPAKNKDASNSPSKGGGNSNAAIVGGMGNVNPDDVPKIDWEFKTYAVQSQRRMVHAIKFFVYEKLPLKPGARAKLHGLQSQAFLNNESVRIIEYNESTGKYLIRPSIPLPEAQKLATTGMLIVDGKNLIAPEQDKLIWTFAALYDGKKVTQNLAQQFIEKIILIVEGLKTMDDTWHKGTEMSCQELFGPILQAQMEAFVTTPEENALDSSLEHCKSVIQQNMKIVLGQANASCGV
jgi:hypothetical protein